MGGIVVEAGDIGEMFAACVHKAVFDFLVDVDILFYFVRNLSRRMVHVFRKNMAENCLFDSN